MQFLKLFDRFEAVFTLRLKFFVNQVENLNPKFVVFVESSNKRKATEIFILLLAERYGKNQS